MSKLKWICTRCASEETVTLHPIETSDGAIEFKYEDKFLRSPTLRKDDLILFCTVCEKWIAIKDRDYVVTCAKSMKDRAGGGVSAETIAKGVAWGIIIASIVLFIASFSIGGLLAILSN